MCMVSKALGYYSAILFNNVLSYLQPESHYAQLGRGDFQLTSHNDFSTRFHAPKRTVMHVSKFSVLRTRIHREERSPRKIPFWGSGHNIRILRPELHVFQHSNI